MRKLLILMAVAILALSNGAAAVTIRAGEGNTGNNIIVPPTSHVVNLYAVGDTNGAFSAAGVQVHAIIGNGDDSGLEPIFSEITFGERNPVDSLVLWFPEAPNSPALDGAAGATIDPLLNGITINGPEIDFAGVSWIGNLQTTDLPSQTPLDPNSKTLIAQFTIDATGFSSTPESPAMFPLGLGGSFFFGADLPDLPIATMDTSEDATLVVALGGDTNLDGTVTVVDLGTLRANLDELGGWEQGDTNGDGQVTVVDLGTLRSNLDETVLGFAGLGVSPPISTAPIVQTPEPVTLGLFAVGSLLILLPRREGGSPPKMEMDRKTPVYVDGGMLFV